ncbi:MAG: metallophosphoesterase [Acetobacteraceae bacterium]|nr:metallophosphoesterase [Acetobacteraceae bacterium]
MNLSPPALRGRGFRGLRIVGDVHGESEPFAAALAGAREARLYVVQLGDLTDYGPDAPGVLRLAFRMLDAREGLFLLGNHDHKLRRALMGAQVRSPAEAIPRTLAQLGSAPDGEALATRAVQEIARAPAWLRSGRRLCVHAGFHPAMLDAAPPPMAGAHKPGPVVSRAMFGQVTGRTLESGYPERLLRWVDRIPRGIMVYVGHDRRSEDGRPLEVQGAQGGVALFLDTGAGKGGHLSWVDLPLE